MSRRKNLKNVAENLKQKLNKIIKNLSYSAISLFYANCTFAVPKEENLSDEIFNAAMQVESSGDKYNGITNVIDSQSVGNAAEQIETATSGNNVLNNAVNGLQNVGSSLGDNMDAVTGGNPLITKLLVVFILVFISIFIIIVLILLARKFVFKKTVNPFVATGCDEMPLDEEFDESKFEDDELPYADDDDDEYSEEELTVKPEPKRTSHTIIPPKSMIERDEKPEVQQENIEQDDIAQVPKSKENLSSKQEQNLQDTVILSLDDEVTAYQRIEEPKDISSAIQIFLKITAE